MKKGIQRKKKKSESETIIMRSSGSGGGRNPNEDPPLPFFRDQVDPVELRRRQAMRISESMGAIFFILLILSFFNIKLGPLAIAIGILLLLGVLLRIIFCLCTSFGGSNDENAVGPNEVELESGRRGSNGRRHRHRSHRHRQHRQPREGNNGSGNNENENENEEVVQMINPLSLRLSLVDRDFTEDDYEVLLALDRIAQMMDNAIGTRPQRGATVTELNELPTHIYKTPQTTESEGCETGKDEKEEKMKKLDEERNICAICLENFGDGDVVTTTPCFHQFHKGCIDTWLAQKAVCPICKYELFKPQPSTFLGIDDDDDDDDDN